MGPSAQGVDHWVVSSVLSTPPPPLFVSPPSACPWPVLPHFRHTTGKVPSLMTSTSAVFPGLQVHPPSSATTNSSITTSSSSTSLPLPPQAAPPPPPPTPPVGTSSSSSSSAVLFSSAPRLRASLLLSAVAEFRVSQQLLFAMESANFPSIDGGGGGRSGVGDVDEEVGGSAAAAADYGRMWTQFQGKDEEVTSVIEQLEHTTTHLDNIHRVAHTTTGHHVNPPPHANTSQGPQPPYKAEGTRKAHHSSSTASHSSHPSHRPHHSNHSHRSHHTQGGIEVPSYPLLPSDR